MWYDAVSIVVILLTAWRGASRGAVWQLAVAGSLVLCVLLAGRISPMIEAMLPLEGELRKWVALGLLYLAISLVTFLVARKLRLWLERVKFIEYDRHVGGLLGAAKGAVVVLVLTSLLAVIVPSLRGAIRDSIAGTSTVWTVRVLGPLLPPRVALGLEHSLSDTPLAPDSPLENGLDLGM